MDLTNQRSLKRIDISRIGCYGIGCGVIALIGTINSIIVTMVAEIPQVKGTVSQYGFGAASSMVIDAIWEFN